MYVIKAFISSLVSMWCDNMNRKWTQEGQVENQTTWLSLWHWSALQSTRTQYLDSHIVCTLNSELWCCKIAWNSYSQVEVSYDVEWGSLNYAFSCDVKLDHHHCVCWERHLNRGSRIVFTPVKNLVWIKHLQCKCT